MIAFLLNLHGSGTRPVRDEAPLVRLLPTAFDPRAIGAELEDGHPRNPRLPFRR